MRYDYLIYIGRFQPFHIGHEQVLRQALSLSLNVIVLIGSAYQPRSMRNPWNVVEREAMLRANFTAEENARIEVSPLLDQLYNDRLWIKSVQEKVAGIIGDKKSASLNIGLIGHSKDNSSEYLQYFPQWGEEEIANYRGISATQVRQRYFEEQEIGELVSVTVALELERFRQTEAYEALLQEYRFIQTYRKAWENAPYEPMFVTVDAVVVQSGHVLLVKRGAQPGYGLMALPGGFLQGDERLRDAVIRELREETRIKVPAPVLAGSILKQRVFDAPYRSTRGRTITHAYLIELRGDEKLPKVKGGDDASRAFWIPFAEVTPEMMFEDHYHIIQEMIA